MPSHETAGVHSTTLCTPAKLQPINILIYWFPASIHHRHLSAFFFRLGFCRQYQRQQYQYNSERIAP